MTFETIKVGQLWERRDGRPILIVAIEHDEFVHGSDGDVYNLAGESGESRNNDLMNLWPEWKRPSRKVLLNGFYGAVSRNSK